MAIEDARWRRSQIDAALWRYFSTRRNWGADWNGVAKSVPSVFRSRIKKMLDADRLRGLDENRWAFYDAPGRGTGSEDRFSTGQAFLLGVGLDLIDLGMNRSEVVFFLRETRPTLEAAFGQLHRRRDALAPVTETARSRYLYADYEKASQPIKLSEGNKRALADFTAWMIVRRFEGREAFPLAQKRDRTKSDPLFIEPELLFGLEAVKRRVFEQLSTHRHFVMVEIADSALTIPKLLREVPEKGRGRPRREEQ